MSNTYDRLDPRVRKNILDAYNRFSSEGQLTSSETVERYIANFRARFAPGILASLDGEALLTLMHDSLNRESMVYWLEFKNDEEFVAREFGSIAGGSAMKFGIFRRKETARWCKGPSQNAQDISVQEAVEIVRSYRDALVEGCRLLDALPSDAGEREYSAMQARMLELNQQVTNVAWGHKYFSLLYPEKLDPWHVRDYQDFNLVRALRKPPNEEGRFVCAATFSDIARDLRLPLKIACDTIAEMNGEPYRYWRVGTDIDGTSSWSFMREHGVAAFGTPDLGDLSWLQLDKESREKLREELKKRGEVPTTAGRNASQILHFATKAESNDIVIAGSGMKVLGVGRIDGPYMYRPDLHARAPHLRPVKWMDVEPWTMSVRDGLQTTFIQLQKYHETHLEIESRLIAATPIVNPDPVIVKVTKRLEGVSGRVLSILERKGQAILYGPPGTGKTYWALRAARDIAAMSAFNKTFMELAPAEQVKVTGEKDAPGFVRFCTFHPSFGYEDFFEGYRPREGANGQLAFSLHPGVFHHLCSDAAKDQDRRYIMIIDEINRGDIPRIFGELLTLMEKDKRGESVVLPLSGERFSVPPNVFIIGTMNTADRSIALLDTALRRRFGFVELVPDTDLFRGAAVAQRIPIKIWLEVLNARIRDNIGRDARNLQVGHAYLLSGGNPITDLDAFTRVFSEDIIPLIEEYCYADFGSLAKILGSGFIDEKNMRIRSELFAPGKRDEFLEALLLGAPEIAASSDTVALEKESAEGDAEVGEGAEAGDEGPDNA